MEYNFKLESPVWVIGVFTISKRHFMMMFIIDNQNSFTGEFWLINGGVFQSVRYVYTVLLSYKVLHIWSQHLFFCLRLVTFSQLVLNSWIVCQLVFFLFSCFMYSFLSQLVDDNSLGSST